MAKPISCLDYLLFSVEKSRRSKGIHFRLKRKQARFFISFKCPEAYACPFRAAARFRRLQRQAIQSHQKSRSISSSKSRRIAGSIRASLGHSVAASRSKALRQQGPGPGVSHAKLLSFHARLAEAAVE